MKYIDRHVEKAIKNAAAGFPVVFVAGPRQVGKTTLLKHIGSPRMEYVTLDDPPELTTARDEPGLFFKKHEPPVIIDEVQYAPGLFSYIKMEADACRAKGRIYITGSQAFHLMKNISDSLAGRVGIINLQGLSLREIKGAKFNAPFLPSGDYFSKRGRCLSETGYREAFESIHRGAMPAMQNKKTGWQLFYSSYVKTYIQRDVRDLTQVGDELAFIKFLTALAARTGQMLNYSDIAKDVGISPPTAERWLSVLVASQIVYLLRPYYNNITKRAIKTPKLYFLDTGLAAYLTRWNDAKALEAGSMAGAFFETFVVAEILKSYYNAGIIDPPFYYYRDKDMREIDLIIEHNGALYPLEIKKTANPRKEDISNFKELDKIPGISRAEGGLICMYDKLLPLDAKNNAIPISYI
jgi:hypothetical protein